MVALVDVPTIVLGRRGDVLAWSDAKLGDVTIARIEEMNGPIMSGVGADDALTCTVSAAIRRSDPGRTDHPASR